MNQDAGLIQRLGGINVVAFVTFLLVQLIICFPVLSHLTNIWFTGSAHHHGAFALPLAGWLIWYRRQGAPPCITNASSVKLSTVIVIPALGLMMIGKVLEISFFQHLAVPGIILAGFVASFGIAHSRYHIAALAFTFFMVPVGDSILLPMQYVTAMGVNALFDITGMAILRDGLLLTTDAGRFNVVEACAGMRFVMAALMISSFYAILTMKNHHTIAAFIGMAMTIAFGVNIMRAYAMVLIATLSDMQLATGVDHFWFGWIMYFLSFTLIIVLGRTLAER